MRPLHLIGSACAAALVAVALWVMPSEPTEELPASPAPVASSTPNRLGPSSEALAMARTRAAANEPRMRSVSFDARAHDLRRGVALGAVGAQPRTLPRRAKPDSFADPQAAQRWYEGELTDARVRLEQLSTLAARMHEEGGATDVVLERVALELADSEAYVAELESELEDLRRPTEHQVGLDHVPSRGLGSRRVPD